MTPQTSRTVFTVAALFNWVVAAALFFTPHLFQQLFQISPPVDQLLWVQLFAGLVFVFGIGYFWASRDLQANRNIVKLGVIGKWAVVVIGLWNVVVGQVSWQFMIPASADGIFAILFTIALSGHSQTQRPA